MGFSYVAPDPALRDIRLEACLFCGNKTHLQVTHNPEEAGRVVGTGRTFITAPSYQAHCCAQFGWGCGASSGHRETEAEAIEAWNRRPSPVSAPIRRRNE
jgi:hypothetical protein